MTETAESYTHQITNPEFFKAGRALFTVTNPTGVHYTYHIKSGQPREGSAEEPPLFASVCLGDNRSYLGIFRPDGPDLIRTRASKFTPDSQAWKVLHWALLMVHHGRELPAGYKIQHNGKCCVCGRDLTNPESIELGIGPECLAKSEGGW